MCVCVQGASSEYGAIMNICWLSTWCQKIKNFDSISSASTSLHADDINIWIMDKNSTRISDVQQDLFMFVKKKSGKFNINIIQLFLKKNVTVAQQRFRLKYSCLQYNKNPSLIQLRLFLYIWMWNSFWKSFVCWNFFWNKCSTIGGQMALFALHQLLHYHNEPLSFYINVNIGWLWLNVHRSDNTFRSGTPLVRIISKLPLSITSIK